MDLLKLLFSMFSTSREKKSVTSLSTQEEYKGFVIIATPAAEESQYRISGRICMGEREHIFIRADVLPTPELCSQETFRKAKLMIDQQGDNIFN